MTASAAGVLGILAGGGSLPAEAALAAQKQGLQVFIVGFAGFADPELLAPFPHEIIRLAAAGDILAALRRHHCRDLVLIGPVRRPAWRDLRPDAEGARILAKLGRAIFSGDDGLLGAVVRVLEGEGFRVRGAHDFLIPSEIRSGALGRCAPTVQTMEDIRRGVQVLDGIAPFDIGQGCVVESGLVLAVEALEGTDAMLQRCAGLKQPGGAGGVLVKMPKTGQELRADMPTIGPETVVKAAASGLQGIAFQAGGTLLSEPGVCIAVADRLGIFLYGFERSHKETTT